MVRAFEDLKSVRTANHRRNPAEFLEKYRRMQLSVKGKQLNIGDALRTHVSDSLSRILGKYFGNAIEVGVTISRDGQMYRAVVAVHVGRGIQVQAQGDAAQPYPAFDTAAEHLAKRLRRYKGRLRDHHKRSGPDAETLLARQYILAADDDLRTFLDALKNLHFRATAEADLDPLARHPGLVRHVHEGLVVVEAMKMENEMRSPIAGVVTEIPVAEGEAVEIDASGP